MCKTQSVQQQDPVDRTEHDREPVEPPGARYERQRDRGHRRREPERAVQQQQEHQGAEPVRQPVPGPGTRPGHGVVQRVTGGAGREPLPDHLAGRTARAERPEEAHLLEPFREPARQAGHAFLRHAQGAERPGVHARLPRPERVGRLPQPRSVRRGPQRSAVRGQRGARPEASVAGRVDVLHPRAQLERHDRIEVRVPGR